MLKRLSSMKGIEEKYITLDLSPIENNLTAVVNVIKEVNVTTMSIVESLMSLMSLPHPNGKPNIRSFPSKFTRVNSLKLWEKCDTTVIQVANKRLKAVEVVIEELEVELEHIFRRLIQTRVSLLNLLTNLKTLPHHSPLF
ncbi:unnamed protein product [Ilex paraguariensis]|uniref:Uncharacterized protein n=1 Tax=Ilex paraguariensis TaxID=185542 RepID=A0ABC8U9A3_9AQUA